MNLDLFNNLFNKIKENDVVENFIKELKEGLEKGFTKDSENLILVEEQKITAKYRDKINIEKGNIVNSYIKETYEEGEMGYIYNKTSGKEGSYNVAIYKNGINNGVIEVEESKLPDQAKVGSILKVQNEEYILDDKGSLKVGKQINEMIQELLQEQTIELRKQRIEGNLYEFVERTGDTAWIINKTNYTGDCFEEIEFPIEELNKAKKGDVFQYNDGKYQKK